MIRVETGVELTDRFARIVKLSHHKDTLEIAGMAEVDFSRRVEGEITPDKKAAAIKEAMRGCNLKCKNAVLVLPKHNVTVRHSRLPSGDETEITQMVQFEAEKHIPFHADRHVISHHIMKKDHIEGSSVLVAAIDSPVVEEQIKILEDAGLSVERADVSSVCGFTMLRFLSSGETDLTRPLAIVNLGALATDITVVSEGILQFTRGASVGVKKLVEDINTALSRESIDENITAHDLRLIEACVTSLSGNNEYVKIQQNAGYETGIRRPAVLPETTRSQIAEMIRQWSSRLLQEIRRTYEFARREFDCPPAETMYVLGEGLVIEDIVEFLSKNLGVSIEPLRPSEKIHISDEEPEKLNVDALYALPMGAVLAESIQGGVVINLLPRSYLYKRAQRHRKQKMLTTASFSFIVAVMLIGFINTAITSRQNYLEWYKAQNQLMRPEVERLVDVRAKTEIIESLWKDETSALAILDTISTYTSIPKQIALLKLSYTRGKILEIAGVAWKIRDINDFQIFLSKSNMFNKIDLKEQKLERIHGKDVQRFRFEAELKGARHTQ